MIINDSGRLPALAEQSLSDLEWFLQTVQTSHYRQSLTLLSGSSIGQHARHIIEFYLCLCEQSQSSTEPVIDYSLRRRDILIESDPEFALQCVSQIRKLLNSLNEEQPCLLICGEVKNAKRQVRSTIGRELIFNIDHTIHHLAIIRMALKHCHPDLHIPEQFGVAHSTIRFRQDACAQ